MAKTAKTNRESLGRTDLTVTGMDRLTRDASEVGMGVITLFAALIGIWGIACLVGGVANEGLIELVNGYISAVSGS